MKEIDEKFDEITDKLKSMLMIPVNVRMEETNIEGSCGIDEKGVLGITLYSKEIARKFNLGCLFYGLKPETLFEAMQLVREHEMVHLIMATIFESEQIGHGDYFMYIAKHFFGHRTMEVKCEGC